MYCKNCGKELQDNDVFCTECGTKVELLEKNDKETTVATSGKKSNVLKIIIGAVVAIGIILVVLTYLGDKPRDIDMEAKELGKIMYTDEKEQYYEDNLHVHGYLVNDPSNQDRYALYSESLDDEDAVIFVFAKDVENTIGDSLGNGSELIVTGTLGHYTDEPSTALLLAKNIEVINKVEPIYSVGTVDDLLENSDKYMNKMVCVVGKVDGVGDFAGIWDTEQDTQIRLEGITGDILYDNVEDWHSAIVTGKYILNDNGEMVIQVENIE